jgi:hypothetical protein
LESPSRAGFDSGLKLLSLGLQYCGSKEGHLFALLRAAQDLGVVEIAYPDADNARRI